jgi:hypothetical protein
MNLLIDTHVLLWWLDDHPTPACPGTFTGSYGAGGAGRGLIFSNIIGIEFYF